MSGSPLPEDIRDWPDEPAELLGVRPNAGLRQLRRAYSQLIRRYKPEHYPAEFRRIRDAFEVLEPLARFYDRQTGAETVDEPAPADQVGISAKEAAADEGTLATGSAAETSPLFEREVPKPTARHDAEGLWRRALDSPDKWPIIYRELSAAAKRPDGDEVLFCRLYWLLKLAPELDSEHRPSDWLAAGLAQPRGRERLVNLYFEELNRKPSEALEERSGALLRQDRPLWQLAEIAKSRWRALHRLKRPELVEEDLKALRPPFYFDRDAWLRLLLSAADVLIWSRSDESLRVFGECCREVDAAGDMHLALGDAFDRYDFVMSLSSDYHRCIGLEHVDLPIAIIRLVPELWLSPVEEIRPQLLEAVAGWVGWSTTAALDQLDSLWSEGPTVGAHVHRVLNELSRARSSREGALDRPRERRVEILIDTHDWHLYRLVRPQLARFCIESGLTLDDILGVIHGRPEYAELARGVVANYLQEDKALQCLLAAHRAFWS